MEVELRPLAKKLRLRAGRLGELPVHLGTSGVTETEVVAARIGVGPERAGASSRRILATGRFDLAMVVGVAGGVRHGLRIGDVLAPSRVLSPSGAEHTPSSIGSAPAAIPAVIATLDQLATGPDVLASLRARGIDAVDMETSSVAEACEEAGVPWLAFRAISDLLEQDLVGDWAMEALRPDGSTDTAAAVRLLVRRPSLLRPMVRVARDMTCATRAAALLAASVLTANPD